MVTVYYKRLIKKVSLLFRDKYFRSAFYIFIIGAFLRFYRLTGFVTFLGDQGRDAVIIKRIITLEHLPAIGAPTSVGQVYLGPFYYYFIAPWLLLTNFNPIGLAVGVAFFSSLYLLVIYFIARGLFDKKTALVAIAMTAFSTVLIDFSRFSWNPNLMPLASLLCFYFFIKSVNSGRKGFFYFPGCSCRYQFSFIIWRFSWEFRRLWFG